jgi:hypothetical protein
MAFLSRLFLRERPRSPLEEFGRLLTPHAIPAAMRTNGSKEDRIAYGVSMAVLVAAHAFASGLQKHVDQMPSMGWKKTYRLPYDDLIVEAAAFCHYIVSKDYPFSDEDDEYYEDDDYDEDEEDDRHGVVAYALLLSQVLLTSHIPNQSDDDILKRRWLFYTNKLVLGDTREAVDLFCSVVLAIIDDAVDDPAGLPGLGPGMHLTMAAATYVPIFHTTQVETLRETILNLFEHSDELLRELDS